MRQSMRWAAGLVLLAMLGWAAGVSAQQAPAADPAQAAALVAQVNQLMAEAEAALLKKDWPEVIRRFEAVLKVAPNVAPAEYNLACAYAMTGKPEEALAHLEKAVGLGFLMVEHIEQDQDLASLRSQPKYAAILAQARATIAERQRLAASIPDPKPVFLRAKGVPAGQATALIVFLHGMGGSPADLEPMLAPLAGADGGGCSLLLPCGSVKLGPRPDGKPAYGWNGAADLEAILAAIAGLEGIRLDQVYLAGFSAGGTMCHFAALAKPGQFAGVMVFSGGLAEEFRNLPAAPADAKRPPVLIVHGKNDQLLPFAAAQGAEQFLRERGYRVELQAWDGGHALPPDVVGRVQAAVAGFAAPVATPKQ